MAYSARGVQHRRPGETCGKERTRAAVDDYVRRAVAVRADQGLPGCVEDTTTLDQLANLIQTDAQQHSRSVA